MQQRQLMPRPGQIDATLALAPYHGLCNIMNRQHSAIQDRTGAATYKGQLRTGKVCGTVPLHEVDMQLEKACSIVTEEFRSTPAA